MTPKEKAKQLVDNYSHLSLDEGFEYTMEITKAKECALICVKELLQQAAPDCDEYEEYYIQLVEEQKASYWNEVKTELNKM